MVSLSDFNSLALDIEKFTKNCGKKSKCISQEVDSKMKFMNLSKEISGIGLRLKSIRASLEKEINSLKGKRRIGDFGGTLEKREVGDLGGT